MAQIALDTVYAKPLAGGTVEVIDFDVDVYESNLDTEPADETTMTLTQTLTADTVSQYANASKWILFKSAGAAVIRENGLISY